MAEHLDHLLARSQERCQRPIVFVDNEGVHTPRSSKKVRERVDADPNRALAQAIRRAQALVRRYVPAGRSLVDELIAERRAESARE